MPNPRLRCWRAFQKFSEQLASVVVESSRVAADIISVVSTTTKMYRHLWIRLRFSLDATETVEHFETSAYLLVGVSEGRINSSIGPHGSRNRRLWLEGAYLLLRGRITLLALKVIT